MARDWNAVAAAITTRMAELEMSQQELASRSGVSVATLRQLQRGMERRRSPRTLTAVSIALQWPAAHLGAVAEGLATAWDSPLAPRHPITDAGDLADLRRIVATLGDRLDAIERRLDAD